MKITRIAVLAFEGVSLFQLSIPAVVFGAIDQPVNFPSYEVHYCALKTGLINTDQNIKIEVFDPLETILESDIVIIPAWYSSEVRTPKEIISILIQAHRNGTIIVGLCLGAFVLGDAGLLDNREATTHWIARELFTKRFPKAKFRPDVLYIMDDNIVTSAGTVAAIDCCLHMVRHKHGADVANRMARLLVTPPHRQGGQAQYIERPAPQLPCENRLIEVLEWAREHLSEQLTLDTLADIAKMSRRTFTRHFRNATGTTVIKWLNAERVASAQQLLETTNLPIECVATQVGFKTALSLRQHFADHLNISPTLYRRNFCNTIAKNSCKKINITSKN